MTRSTPKADRRRPVLSQSEVTETASVAPTTRVETDRADIASHQLSYARLTVIGILVIALGSLLAKVLSLVVATVVWRFGRWTLLLSALYGLPPLIICVVLLSFTFMHLDSFLQFLPVLLVLGIGSLTSLIAGTRGFSPATAVCMRPWCPRRWRDGG